MASCFVASSCAAQDCGSQLPSYLHSPISFTTLSKEEWVIHHVRWLPLQSFFFTALPSVLTCAALCYTPSGFTIGLAFSDVVHELKLALSILIL